MLIGCLEVLIGCLEVLCTLPLDLQGEKKSVNRLLEVLMGCFRGVHQVFSGV